jgi:hypothetical protein
MKRIPPAIRKSLLLFNISGKGISNARILLARLLKAPIAQILQDILAPKKAPIITPGQARDHMMSAPRFLDGSGGPRKSISTIPKKIGRNALWRIAGKSGLSKACLMGLNFKRLYLAWESDLLLSSVRSCLLTTPPGETRTLLLIALASSRSFPGHE